MAMTGSETLGTDVLRAFRAGLSVLEGTDDAERIDLLAELEAVKAAACAAQARIALDLEASQRERQRAAGVPESDLGRGVASQVALARRESPARGRRLLGLAHALTELPHTYAALAAGETSEWRAMLVARETAWLTRGDRLRVDAELASRPGGIGSLGDRGTEAETRRVGYRLDPAGAVRRCAHAVAERRVSLRPAPDTMTRLSALLPVREGVALYAALSREADTVRAQGDPRSRGQVMADTLVERATRVTGQTAADQVPLEVHLVMTDTSLLGSTGPEGPAGRGEAADLPALLHGHGLAPVEVPAPLARSWVRDADDEAQVWLRRLYASPHDGSLVAMDSRRRVFTGLLRRLVVLRDQTCRTPWCDAPVRHVDHVTRAADGGPTRFDNAEGLCVACNQAREAPGWQARVVDQPGRRGAVETTIPSGHRFATRPPPLLRPPGAGPSLPEGLIVDLVWRHACELVA